MLLGLAGLAGMLNVALGKWIQKQWRERDPGAVVIDEVAGQWIALSVPLRSEHPWIAYPLAFLLFRLFDIFKPLGARRLEKLPAGWGILLDDVLVGIYTALVLWGVGFFL